MFQYTFENKPMYDDDWGSCYFTVTAKNEHEAWKKACELEYRENIIGIVHRWTKYLGNI